MRHARSRRFLLAAAFAAATLTLAAADEAPPPRYLDIPGLGRVPIPGPPGARMFLPQQGRAVRPPAEPETLVAPPRPATREAALDDLFRRLAAAESVEQERALVAAIGRLWARSGSPTADLLLGRAAAASSAGDSRLALDLLDRIVALEPGWAQALVGRADARLAAGDLAGAERDLEEALRREPRRFDALGALGALWAQSGALARALDAYRRALALDPRREDWRQATERLRLELDGRDI